MDRQRVPYHVEDPRLQRWVAKGLWPDCPDCHGLLAARVGPIPPLFPRDDEVIDPVEIPFPCPTCQKRTIEAGFEIPRHFWSRGPSVLYGTWPDCPSCAGAGGRWYKSSWDGHRSERDLDHCRNCRARTRKFQLSHPTELDHILEQQEEEARSHLTSWHRLHQELKETESILKELNQKHSNQLREPTEQLWKQLRSSRLVGSDSS